MTNRPPVEVDSMTGEVPDPHPVKRTRYKAELDTLHDVKALHELAESVLFDWLDEPPTGLRQLKALELLAEAGQMLRAACINLGAVELSEGDY